MTFSKERLDELADILKWSEWFIKPSNTLGTTVAMQNVAVLHEAAKALPQYIEALEEARKAMQEFVDKCNRGEARSVRSYASFTQALSTIHTLSQPQREG